MWNTCSACLKSTTVKHYVKLPPRLPVALRTARWPRIAQPREREKCRLKRVSSININSCRFRPPFFNHSMKCLRHYLGLFLLLVLLIAFPRLWVEHLTKMQVLIWFRQAHSSTICSFTKLTAVFVVALSTSLGFHSKILDFLSYLLVHDWKFCRYFCYEIEHFYVIGLFLYQL